jgi:plasmid stabilization system protein ParE
MSHIKLSETAKNDIKRFHDFLEPLSFDIADEAIEKIYSSFDILEIFPLSGPSLPSRKELRKFVIPYGEKGYIAFYKYYKETDTCVIAKIFHQNEKYTKKDLRTLHIENP